MLAGCMLFLYANVTLANESSTEARPSTCVNSLVTSTQVSIDSLATTELKLMRRYSAKIKRKGGTVHIRLQNGRVKKIINTPISEDDGYFVNGKPVADYRVEAYFPKLGFFVLHKQLYEGDAYLLVSDVDGTQLEVQGYPIFSPDGKRFVSAFDDPYDPWPSFDIYAIRGKSIVREFSADVRWPEFVVVWHGNDAIELLEGTVVAPSATCLTKYVFRRAWTELP